MRKLVKKRGTVNIGRRKGNRAKRAVNLVVFALLIVATICAVYFITKGSLGIPASVGDNTAESSNTGDGTTAGTDSGNGVTGTLPGGGTLKDGSHINAADYLPEPYLKFTYTSKFPDGYTETINAVSATLEGFSAVSIVEQLLESETFVIHFIVDAGSVYSFLDDEYELNKTLWLIDEPAVGEQWEDEGVRYTVHEIGASCDAGFGKVEDCIVLQTDYEDGASEYMYLAPGLGMIMIMDKETGFIYSSMVSYSAAGIKEADDLLKQYALNAVKAME